VARLLAEHAQRAEAADTAPVKIAEFSRENKDALNDIGAGAVTVTVNEHPRRARSRSRKTVKETTMATAAQTKIQPSDQIAAATPDLAAVKTKQQAAWSSGDYAIVGTTLQIVGEELCETLDLRAGQKVLDVAAGNGNVSLAAARRWCNVVSTDYVPALLERGRARATADGLTIEFKEADAEALPFADDPSMSWSRPSA
jgi:precorrin-6B methylase 2